MDQPALKMGNVGPVAEMLEQLLAAATAQASATAREEGWRAGYQDGRREERETWRARLRGMLGEERDTGAGAIASAPQAVAPAAAEECRETLNPGGDDVAAQGGDNRQDGAEVEQPAPAETAGLEAPSDAGGVDRDDEQDGRQEGSSLSPCATELPGASPAAAAGAPEAGPCASPPVQPEPAWEDWRTPARETRLRELWPQVGLSLGAILKDLAGMEGPTPPTGHGNVSHWAKRLNLPARWSAEAVAAAPPPEPAPAAAPTGPQETEPLKRARELLGMGLHPNDIKAAVRLTALEFAEIQRAHRQAA